MEEQSWQRLKGDTYLMVSMVPMIINRELPYLKKISNDVLSGNKLDKNYQSKMVRLLLDVLVDVFPQEYVISKEHLRDSYQRSLDMILEAVNSIETDDPAAYGASCRNPLNGDNLQVLLRENLYHLKDSMEIMQRCSHGTALSTLKDSFQTTFENMYKPAHEHIRLNLSADNLKKDSYRLTEEILCMDRTMEHDGKLKSDVREIRNLMQHAHRREGDHLTIQFQDGGSLNLTEDDLIQMTVITGVKSLHMEFFCNMFMLLRMYDIGYPLIETSRPLIIRQL